MTKKPLSDNETHDVIWRARDLLIGKKGATERAETTLRAAQAALGALAFGLLAASEYGDDDIGAIIEPSKVNEL